jgi:hypothetical protein
MIQKRVTIDETKNEIFLVDTHEPIREQMYTNILFFVFLITICISLYYGYLHIAVIVLLLQFLYSNTYDFSIYENLNYYYHNTLPNIALPNILFY